MGVFDDIGHWFSGAAKTIGSGISHAATGLVDFASSTIGKLTGAVMQPANKALSTVSHTVQGVATTAGTAVVGVSHEVGGAASSLGSSFAWPLALAGGAVGLGFVLTRR